MLRLLTLTVKETDNHLVVVFDDLRPTLDLEKEEGKSPVNTPDALIAIVGLALASYPFFSEQMGLPSISQDKELSGEIHDEINEINEIKKWLAQHLLYHVADPTMRDHLLDKNVSKMMCFEQTEEAAVSGNPQKNSLFMRYDIGDSKSVGRNAYFLNSTEFILPKVPHLALYFLHHLFAIFRHVFANPMITFSLAKQSLKDFVSKKDQDNNVIDTTSIAFQRNLLYMLSINNLAKETVEQQFTELCQAFMTQLTTVSETHCDDDLALEQIRLLNKKMTEWKALYRPKDALIERPEDILFIPMRLEMLFDKNQLASFFINHDELLPLRFGNFMQILNQVPSKNQEISASEKKFIARCVNYLIKKALFSEVLGKKAYDGKEYDFNDTEWFLLIFANFLLQNGAMCISDIRNNPAYKLFYAEGKIYHDIYEKKIRHLFAALGLTFINDNVRDVIQFDADSSQYLAVCGVHWTADQVEMVKENQLSQSQFSLFNHITAKQRSTRAAVDHMELHETIKMYAGV